MRSAVVRTRRRTLISVVVTVAALGWAPGQALAADSPVDPLLGSVAQTTSGAADLVDPVQGIVDQAADTVSGTADTLSDPLPDPVDEVVDTTTDTVEGVSGATSGIVDPVSDATSGTVDAVAGSTTDVVDGVTDALGDRLRLERFDVAGRSVCGRGAGCVLSRIFRQGWDRLGVVDQGDGVRRLRRSGPARGTRRRWSGLRRRLDTLRHGDTDDVRDDEPGRPGFTGGKGRRDHPQAAGLHRLGSAHLDRRGTRALDRGGGRRVPRRTSIPIQRLGLKLLTQPPRTPRSCPRSAGRPRPSARSRASTSPSWPTAT